MREEDIRLLDADECFSEISKYRTLLLLKYSYIVEDRQRDADAQTIEGAVRSVDGYTKRARAANAAQQRAASEGDADEVQEQRRIMLQNTLNAIRAAKRALTTTKPTPFEEVQYNEHPNSVPDNSDGVNIYMESNPNDGYPHPRIIKPTYGMTAEELAPRPKSDFLVEAEIFANAVQREWDMLENPSKAKETPERAPLTVPKREVAVEGPMGPVRRREPNASGEASPEDPNKPISKKDIEETFDNKAKNDQVKAKQQEADAKKGAEADKKLEEKKKRRQAELAEKRKAEEALIKGKSDEGGKCIVM